MSFKIYRGTIGRPLQGYWSLFFWLAAMLSLYVTSKCHIVWSRSDLAPAILLGLLFARVDQWRRRLAAHAAAESKSPIKRGTQTGRCKPQG